jgi:cytoskeletal protein CcmA (bactofilin family)
MAKRGFDPSLAETVIGNGLHVKGTLNCTSDIWIDGIVEGNVTAEGNIFVSLNGRITGNLQAAHISVSGQVIGNLKARDRLVVEGSGHIKGDVEAEKLAIADGAIVNGNLKMPDQQVDSPAGDNNK